jgi:hypothetical protein
MREARIDGPTNRYHSDAAFDLDLRLIAACDLASSLGLRVEKAGRRDGEGRAIP